MYRVESYLGRTTRPIFILLCCATLVWSAAAQTNTAAVTGSVQDSSGAAVAGATLTAVNVQTGIQKTATTDESGRYTVLDLAPGFYDVSATQQGFATIVRKNQEFLVGTTVTMNFAMQVASVNQTVEVDTASPVMETTQSSVSRILGTQELDNLPVLNRSFANLAVLTPGVQSSGGGFGGITSGNANVSIGNAPSYETGYVIDGMTNEAGNQGGLYVNMAQDWIQEFSVLSLQFPTEFGSAGGGVVNAVTRSGGNQIHGRAYGYYQNADLNENPGNQVGAVLPSATDRFGAMVGGPIKKDRLFYFTGLEWVHTLSTGALSTSVLQPSFASTAQPVGTPAAQLEPWLLYGAFTNATTGAGITDDTLGMIKLDYTPNSKDSFNVRGNIDWATAGGVLSGNGYGATSRGSYAPNYSLNAAWTRTFSASVVNELRFALFLRKSIGKGNNYFDDKGLYSAADAATINQNPYNYVTTASLGAPTPFGNPVGIFANVGYSGVSTGGASSVVLNADDSGIISDTITISRGNHELKVGGQLRKYYLWAHDAHNTTDGSYTFNSAAKTTFNPYGSSAALVIPQNNLKGAEALGPQSYILQFPSSLALTNFDFHNYAFGGFMQDSWKITPSLTMNLGLRYDFSNQNSELSHEPFPALEAALPGSVGYIKPGFQPINNDPYDISPRVGFAWSPFHGKRSTVIRGGLSIFYDQDDTAFAGVYITGTAWAPTGYAISATTASQNPYCVGNNSCANGIPVVDETAVIDVLSSALANYTVPQFPNSTAPCATTNSCTVTVGPNTYTIPALTVTANPQGNLLDIAPNLRTPGTFQATAGFQQQVSKSLNVSLDYVFHRGFNGIVAVNNNIALTGLGATSTYTLINPAYTTGYQLQSTAYLLSNDLQAKVRYNDHRGDLLQMSYQFGHSNDDSYSNFGISAHDALTTNPFDPKTDYGPSNLDAHHQITVAGDVNLHWGFHISPIMAYSSALPYSATSANQVPGSSAACPLYFTRCYPVGYSRDSLRADPSFSLSARMSKMFKLGESRSITAFIEGYNLTSHWNGVAFNANVDVTTGPNAFGLPTSAVIPLRQLQVGAKFDF